MDDAPARSPELVVGIPVCNEKERITDCIDALATTLAQRPRAGVVLLVNNSVDASAETAFLALATRGLTAMLVNWLGDTGSTIDGAAAVHRLIHMSTKTHHLLASRGFGRFRLDILRRNRHNRRHPLNTDGSAI